MEAGHFVMLVIQHPIQNIRGRVCTKLLAMQFWHRGELSSDLVSIFLGLDNGSWHKIFFDGGVFFWKEQPPLFDTQPSDEFHYPHVDLSSDFPIINHAIEDVVATEMSSDSAALRIVCGSGSLVLNHKVKVDQMRLSYEVRV